MTQATKPRVVFWIPVDIYKNAVLPEIQKVEGIDLVVLDGPEKLAEALEGASAFISAGASKYTADVAAIVREHGKGLRWFQTVAAGNDGFVMHGVPDHVTVTSSGGHSAPVVAEHAMALLLSISHCVPDLIANAQKELWSNTFRPRYRSMFNKTVAVIGLGRIGQEISKRAAAFDMKVIGVTRSGAPVDGIDRIVPISSLTDILPEVDATIIAAPLTPETTHLINEAAFAAMKQGAYLVNISRGPMVDQVALRAALESGHLGGAGLDVSDPEPLPAGDPLWGAPNLILSPHTAGGGSPDSPKRLAAAVKANLERFLAGEPLQHILPFGAHAK